MSCFACSCSVLQSLFMHRDARRCFVLLTLPEWTRSIKAIRWRIPRHRMLLTLTDAATLGLCRWHSQSDGLRSLSRISCSGVSRRWYSFVPQAVALRHVFSIRTSTWSFRRLWCNRPFRSSIFILRSRSASIARIDRCNSAVIIIFLSCNRILVVCVGRRV